jgi:exodeoxyribonuclease V alpha subunit
VSAELLEGRFAVRARPLLARFNSAAVLSSADVHVAQRLGRLTGEDDERVLLAVALTVRAVRNGSVCLTLTEAAELAVPDAEDGAPVEDLPWPVAADWEAAVLASPMVAVGVDDPVDRPVRWVDGRLYLDRYWRDEQLVRTEVDARLSAPVQGVDAERLAAAVARLFPAAVDERQRQAAATCARSRLTVLTGGPGTGKTTTVARLLAVLHDVTSGGLPASGLRVALAAPTGKAAARLQEAVRGVVGEFDEADRRRVGQPEATTVHRLLGWKPGSSTRFRHDRSNHLPHDLVVVDETSMVSLPLMARLLEALRPTARLLLVGDPDQLASVEAGAVLGDLVARSSAGVVRLDVVHRHGEDIGELATAIREGRADDVLAVLRRGDAAVSFVETAAERPSEAEVAAVRADAVAAGRAVVEAARAGDAAGALRALERHRLLLAHSRGPAGIAHWAAQVEAWVAAAAGVDEDAGGWYPGRPLLVTANDRDTGLYNGDTGVVVADGDGGVVAVFGDPTDPRRVRPHRLPPVETVHAMTVHRGQGSQFARVSLLLPPATSPLLTRELLYTAVTRAREHVRVVGTEAAVRAAVERPVRRASGLRSAVRP